MALSGIEIFKLLPGGQKPPHAKANCKECGIPTCMAFAMKLAAKQLELAACPYVSQESKEKLAASSAPPIRLVSLGGAVKAGNETCLFRHEKTFYNKPALFVPAESIEAAEPFKVNYVGIDLMVDGYTLRADSASQMEQAARAIRAQSKRPLILCSSDPGILQAGLAALPGEKPLLAGANSANWAQMAALAKTSGAPLAVCAESIEELADLTEKIKAAGVEDIVLDPSAATLAKWLTLTTQIRRLALKNTRALGYPVLAFPGRFADEGVAAAQAIAKYAGFVALSTFQPALIYPLLVLRENIYTDPQKPIQVAPGLYEINNPNPASPVLVTTNFSITYFSIANEVESSGLPAWLLVTDAEGMSVLTAWAAGKFDAERIAKAVKGFGIAEKIAKKRIVIPGHVAMLSGELEEELPGWEIRVGPREAVDVPSFMKQALN